MGINGLSMRDQDFRYERGDASGRPLSSIPYKRLDLGIRSQSFGIAQELITKGIQKFVADYQSTLRRSANLLCCPSESALSVIGSPIVTTGVRDMGCALFDVLRDYASRPHP